MRSISILIVSFFSLGLFAQKGSSKLLISHLTGDFYVYTTFGDPGDGDLYPANGMYVLTNAGAVLIDTPWDTTQFQPLLDSIWFRHRQKVSLCFATHFHEDRTAGLEYYRKKGIKTYTTKQTDGLSKRRHKARAEFLMAKDTSFRWGQQSFEVFYPGKGHSPDNIVLWFGKEKILYGGCFVKSTEADGPGNLSDADIGAWIISIKKVQSKFPQTRYIIPGHQSWTSSESLNHTLKILETHRAKNK